MAVDAVTSRKQPPLISGLGGHLREVAAYGRWLLTGGGCLQEVPLITI